MKTIISFTIFCLSGLLVFAQTTTTSGDIYLQLRKLNTLGSVLYIAAHPDDENTRLLAYLSKEKLYRTGYLSLTRGDGGQNLIGNEQGIELGLIRTQELLAARKIDGAEQFFTRAYDFGFSKTPEETFTKWDREKILADVVFVIRQFQPDVIITRFPTTGEGGHGHHTASAILANEAFDAAANPARFPEQLKWVQPWQAKRILWNGFNFGNAATQRDDQLRLDVGGYNPVLGKSYGEIAAESRSQHKSQGFGVPRSRGEALEYFKATGGVQPAVDLFEGVNTTWQRVKGSDHVSRLVEAAISSFDFLQPQKSLPQLVTIYKSIKLLPNTYWKAQKTKEVINLIEAASGLWAEAFATQQFGVQGDSIRLSVVVNNRSGSNISAQRIAMASFDTSLKLGLSHNKNIVVNVPVKIPETHPVTQPYWLKEQMEEGYFNVTEPLLIGKAEDTAAFQARFSFLIEGEEIDFIKPVQYKFTDPVRGELYQPLVVLPPLTLSVDEEIKLSKGTNNFKGQITATAKRKNISLQVKETTSEKNDNPKVTYTPQMVHIKSAGEGELINYSVVAAKDNQYSFGIAGNNNLRSGLTEHNIRYDHIPDIHYFSPAVVKNRKLDLETKGKRIGYIVGAGDKVPQALEAMGYEVTILGDKELARLPLKNFDAIITGVRAYNTAAWINNHYQKLMKYVSDGGNMIVQYNTNNGIEPLKAKMGPYPFAISRNRITNEAASVTFINPKHQVLNYPNVITAEDFKGWVQERSIYHASDVDKAFETVVSMADPGEQPDPNSLIIAKWGKGYFTYTGIVFFRELPAGVPGAYRLMANLIALNQKKEL